MEISLPRLPEPVTFRFLADFDIQIQPKEIAGFTERQTIMLRAIAASPATLRRIACMRLETDLEGITGSHLSGLFEGLLTKKYWSLFYHPSLSPTRLIGRA